MSLSRMLSAFWTPSIPLAASSKLPSTGLHDSCSRGFHFLIRLAWESRYLFPIMYTVVSFLFDIQMRLEIIIHRERRAIAIEEEIRHNPLDMRILPIPEEEEEEERESEDGEIESGSQIEEEGEEQEDEEISDDDMALEY